MLSSGTEGVKLNEPRVRKKARVEHISFELEIT